MDVVKTKKGKTYNFIFYLVCIALCIVVIYPSVRITLFSYPAQDDFYYAATARELMKSGYTLTGQAIHMCGEYYKTLMGGVSSTFCGFWFSGLIQCDLEGIRVFEFVVALLFYIALAFFVHAVTRHVMGYSRRAQLFIYTMLVCLICGVAYYGDFDVFFWFITSIQYLFLLMFAFLGGGLCIKAIYSNTEKSRWCLYGIGTLSILISIGANLCIVAFAMELVAIISLIGLVVLEGRQKRILLLGIIPLVGSIVNGLAPGYYVRIGEGHGGLTVAIIQTLSYEFERISEYFQKPEFCIVVLLLIIGCQYITTNEDTGVVECRLPAVAGLVGFICMAGSIFPAMFGYGYETYKLLIRGIVISDMVFLVSFVFCVAYVSNWFKNKYCDILESPLRRDATIGILIMVCFLAVSLRGGNWRWIGIIRQYRDLSAGRIEDYTDYYVDILKQVEESTSDIPIIYVDEIEERTVQINPLLDYDTETDVNGEYANHAMSQFFEKDGIIIYRKQQ